MILFELFLESDLLDSFAFQHSSYAPFFKFDVKMMPSTSYILTVDPKGIFYTEFLKINIV